MPTIYNDIQSLAKLGDFLLSDDKILTEVIKKASIYNPWFTISNIQLALKNIAIEFLQKDKLINWLEKYPQKKQDKNFNVGIIMAGNLPLVGVHDLLSTLITQNNAIIKLSSKDNILFPFVLEKLLEIDNSFKNRITITDRLTNFDAVIATGSNNSNRYFKHYFGKYPHIIRNNRTSVAVLTGNESEKDLENLGHDIFSFFGLGCRNVSKIFIPKNYDLTILLKVFDKFTYIAEHTKYKNNFDYNLTLLLMNNVTHLHNECIIVTENKALFAPISTLYYQTYTNLTDLQARLKKEADNIQCIVSHPENDLATVAFGNTQQPTLTDYADGIDTVNFLLNL